MEGPGVGEPILEPEIHDSPEQSIFKDEIDNCLINV
jgi:hypothetical protein